MEKDKINISVIIVSWNAKEYLIRCIDNLKKFTEMPAVEIIVVDNASEDGSPEAIKLFYPEVKLLQLKKNMGFAKANNIGITESNGKYICLLNSDIEIINNCIDKLFVFMENNLFIGVIGPRIYNSDLTNQYSCRKYPTLWNNFCSASGLSAIFKNYKLLNGEELTRISYNKFNYVEALSGCFLFVRNTAIKEVGVLDERFFMYSEDIDWCYRFNKANWKIVYFPEAKAIHHCGKSSNIMPINFAIMRENAVLQYWEKHHGPFKKILMRGNLLLKHFNRILYRIANNKKYDSIETKINELRIHKACLKWLISGKKFNYENE